MNAFRRFTSLLNVAIETIEFSQSATTTDNSVKGNRYI